MMSATGGKLTGAQVAKIIMSTVDKKDFLASTVVTGVSGGGVTVMATKEAFAGSPLRCCIHNAWAFPARSAIIGFNAAWSWVLEGVCECKGSRPGRHGASWRQIQPNCGSRACHGAEERAGSDGCRHKSHRL